MKIAYITTMKQGLPSFVFREMEHLANTGLEVGVFATKHANGLFMPKPDWFVHRMRPIPIMLGQPLYFSSRPRRYNHLLRLALRTHSVVDFLVAGNFAAAMKRWSVDAIHTVEGLHALAIGYYCQQLLNVPLSVTIHTDALYLADNWPICPIALAACQFVTTVCEFNRRKLIDEFAMPPERVHLVRMGVNTTEFHPDNSIKILIVAQFAQRKGHEILLKALKQTNRNNLHLWVVGASSWGSIADGVDVPQLAQDLGIANKVTFWGQLSGSTLRTLFQSCDIFCLPSRHYIISEGVPVSLMEAMACAKPVISTRHAGIPELVPEILVNENDVTALAEALVYLADRPDVRQAMGLRNQSIVEERYSIQNAAKMGELFLGKPALRTGRLEEVNHIGTVDDQRNRNRWMTARQ